MGNFIPQSRIDRELSKLIQVPVAYNLTQDFPYPELGTRRYELLLYVLFRRGVEIGWFDQEFTGVEMTPAASSNGRQIILTYKGRARGVVLSKQKPAATTAPDLAREIIRFLLLGLRADGTNLEDPDFVVFLAVAGNINPAAVQLVSDFNHLILQDSRLSYWVEEVIETNSALRHLQYDEIIKPLENQLARISVELILPEHIDKRLAEAPDIKSAFFGVEMVSTEQVLRKIVREFNLKSLSDEEASKLLERLEEIPQENRMGAGLLNFFGYPREFLQSIAGDDRMRAIMLKGAEFKAEIDYAVLDFLQLKSVFFSEVLLADADAKIGELAKLAVPTWIFSRFAIKYVKNTDSKVLEGLLRDGKNMDFVEGADIDKIRDRLLQRIQRMAEIDEEPGLIADPREARKQEKIYQLSRGLLDIEDFRQTFDQDWELLKPILNAIEKRMLLILPKNPTILIEDMGALDDRSRFNRLMDQVRQRVQPFIGNRSNRKKSEPAADNSNGPEAGGESSAASSES